MGYSSNASERSQMSQQVVEKALKDDDFRSRLLSDPKGTLEEEYGVRLSPDVRIHVHTESPRDFHLVLPSAPSASSELSADEVDAPECSGWGSAAECALECTQCGNNDTTCQPGPTEG